jgi:lipoprotein-releasing system permease protein
MIILEKTREFGILQSMGLTKSQVREIIIKEGTIIGLSGSILGILLSLSVLYLESVYHIIQLPNDIYFMNYLPVKISSVYFFFYPIITFLITIGFSYIPAKHACKITPSEALRYE